MGRGQQSGTFIRCNTAAAAAPQPLHVDFLKGSIPGIFARFSLTTQRHKGDDHRELPGVTCCWAGSGGLNWMIDAVGRSCFAQCPFAIT